MKKTDLLMDSATLIAAASACIVGFSVIRGGGAGNAAGDIRVDDWETVMSGGHRLGPADARVTIVEFGDYECPACRGWHHQLKPILRDYAEEVAFVYRHFPLPYHQKAYPAARAAECAADQGKFWVYHWTLFEEDEWLEEPSSVVRVGVPIDVDAFEACAASSSAVAEIEGSIAMAQRMGARGTPTVVINGRMLASPPDSATLRRLVEAGLK